MFRSTLDLGFLGPVGQASVVIIPHLITCVASTSPSLSYLTIPYSLTHQVPRLFRLESPRIDSPSPPFLNCISSQSGLDNPTPRHHNKTADPYSHSHSWYIKTVYWFSATDTSLFSSSFFFFLNHAPPPPPLSFTPNSFGCPRIHLPDLPMFYYFTSRLLITTLRTTSPPPSPVLAQKQSVQKFSLLAVDHRPSQRRASKPPSVYTSHAERDLPPPSDAFHLLRSRSAYLFEM